MTNKNNASLAIQDLYNNQQHQAHQMSDLATQVEKIRRYTKYDTKAQVAHTLEHEEAILKSIESLGAQTATLLGHLQDEKVEDGFYRAGKLRRQTEVLRNSRYNRLLTGLKQKIINKPCVCGKHKTLQFLDPNDNVIEELCPRSWWFKRSRIAMEDGKLTDFVSSTPEEVYLKAFKLA